MLESTVKSSAPTDSGATNRTVESADVARPIAEHTRTGVEFDDETFITFLKYAVEKLRSGLLFDFNLKLLAAAGVNQKSDRKRQSFFVRKKGDFLLDFVLEDFEITLIEVLNDGFIFVKDGGIKIHERNADVNGLIG
jgi:hypothetical protein